MREERGGPAREPAGRRGRARRGCAAAPLPASRARRCAHASRLPPGRSRRGVRLRAARLGSARPCCLPPPWRRRAWSGCWCPCGSWWPGAPPGPWCSAAWCPTSRSTGTSAARRTPRASPPTCAWCCWWPTSCGYSSGKQPRGAGLPASEPPFGAPEETTPILCACCPSLKHQKAASWVNLHRVEPTGHRSAACCPRPAFQTASSDLLLNKK